MSSSGTVPLPAAALFTITSSRPHVSSASRTMVSVPAPVVMSPVFSIASPPASRIIVTVSSAALHVVHHDPGPAPGEEEGVFPPEPVVRPRDRDHPSVEPQLVHGGILTWR